MPPLFQTCKLFKLLRKEAAVDFPRVAEISLHTDWSASEGGARQFAYCEQRARSVRIVVAPDIEELGSDHLEAILQHEISHGVSFLYSEEEIRDVLGSGIPKTPERSADEIAYRIWGVRIKYHGSLCLQSLAQGVSPRPGRLGF